MNPFIKIWESSPKSIVKLIKTSLKNQIAEPVWTTVKGGPLKGSELFIDVNSFSGWESMILGDFDSFIYAKLNERIDSNNNVFWDIGAHFGYHSLCFASLFPAISKVYSFEPNPFNAQRFLKNVERNSHLSDKIFINNLALSNSDNVSKFTFSDSIDFSESSGSHLSEVEPPLKKSTYSKFMNIEVTTRKLDTLLNDNIIEPAHIVKIDVEGAEMLVLEGGMNFFRKYKPFIFMEVHNITMMLEVSNYLHDIGYRIEMIDKESTTSSWCFIFAYPDKI